MTQPRLLGNRYELDGVVGRGGMAEVYRARDIRLDRIVAVKTLREDLARDQTFQARFRREAQSAASLNHPSIVAVYDTGEDMAGPQHVPYIVMEYVDGRTLRELLRDDRRLLPERALEITDGVLRALDYSHRNGIVHRDIKPGNVMLTRSAEVKVMDFGIARAVSDAQATMTQTAQVIGTAQYLSPEQARGERVDARSDLYSTGCLLYELLTGRPPFTGDSPVAIAYQHVRENPIPPSRVDPEIPVWADSIVLKAMAKDPAERYQSAADMRTDIQRALSWVPADGTGHDDGRGRADRRDVPVRSRRGRLRRGRRERAPQGAVVDPGHRRRAPARRDRLPAAQRRRGEDHRSALGRRPDRAGSGHLGQERGADPEGRQDGLVVLQEEHGHLVQSAVRHEGGAEERGHAERLERSRQGQGAVRGRRVGDHGPESAAELPRRDQDRHELHQTGGHRGAAGPHRRHETAAGQHGHHLGVRRRH